MELFIIYLLFVHWIADFLLQSDSMAQRKSFDNRALTLHILTYYLVFLVATLNLYYASINALIHWVVDYFTSKKSKYYFDKQDYHNGFVVVGFDQFVHLATLLLTYWWIYGKSL